MIELSPRQLLFIKHYTSGLHSAAQAARMAGYAEAHARRSSQYILKNPKVLAAIAEARTKLVESTQYDSERAMAELDTAVTFARETKNATAMARCIELKMKLTGLLIDRVQVETIDLSGVLIEARRRVALTYAPALIEGESQ